VPQHYDQSFLALLTGLPLLAIFVAALYVRRRSKERATLAGGSAPESYKSEMSAALAGEATPRRRPVTSNSPPGDRELASAIRSTILRVVAERAPAGWTILVLCPPPSATLMTWHVHLAPAVAVDVPDGRSVPVSAPSPSHAWQMPGGRSVGVGNGDPEPAPAPDARAVRVSGPYLQISLLTEADQPPVLLARVEGSPDGSPELRASPTDLKAAQTALREAVELAIGSRMLGAPPTLGYGLGAWHGHERVWLTIGQ
jgi:hypothetical protein